RNVITRSLGNTPNVDVDVFSEEIQTGDVFLLCSDGLTGEVSDDEIRCVLTASPPSEAAWELVDLALENGGRDNVTVLIVAVREIARVAGDRREKRKGLARLLHRRA
ncbi:MAG: SpoIIE family protein phosphatase, partial [Armatimonadota bacterium]